MTDTLQDAIKQLEQMPADRQDLLARLLLHEIAQDKLWEQSTETHADKLKSLVEDILVDDDHGKCEPLNPDEL